MIITEHLYRYEKQLQDETISETSVKIVLREFRILAETSKGFWFVIPGGKKKWTSNTAKNRYAYPTKKEAILNFQKRTDMSIRIMKNNIIFSEIAIKLSEKLEIK